MFMLRKKTEIPSAADALPGRQTPIPTAAKHFINQRPLKGPYPDGLETAMFGLRLLLGRRAQVLGTGRRHSRHRGRLCRRPHAQPDLRGGLLAAAPATTRSCWWSTIRRRSPTRSCSRPSGKATTRPRACARATTSARSTAPASTSTSDAQRKAAEASKAMYEKALKAQGLRRHHHRDPRRAAVLLRRGLSPAIPGEESDGLLRPRRHRRELSDRNRRGCALTLGNERSTDWIDRVIRGAARHVIGRYDRRYSMSLRCIWLQRRQRTRRGASHAEIRARHRGHPVPEPLDAGAVLSRARVLPAADAVPLRAASSFHFVVKIPRRNRSPTSSSACSP